MVLFIGLPALAIAVGALIWILGYVLLFASLGVWFPRQVYIVLVPFALLIGIGPQRPQSRARGTDCTQLQKKASRSIDMLSS